MNKKFIGILCMLPLIALMFLQPKATAENRNHKIEWVKKPCIQPISHYDYNTCSKLEVIIDDHLVIIPKGFITDLASIPRLFWPILAPQYAGFVYPAILHDFLYRCPDGITRKYADDVLYSALLAEGVSRYTATKFWLGVRTFGGAHFADQNNCKYKYSFEPLPSEKLNYYFPEVDND